MSNLTTKACRQKKCPHITLVPGVFGYRCSLTGLVPREMDQCPAKDPLLIIPDEVS